MGAWTGAETKEERDPADVEAEDEQARTGEVSWEQVERVVLPSDACAMWQPHPSFPCPPVPPTSPGHSQPRMGEREAVNGACGWMCVFLCGWVSVAVVVTAALAVDVAVAVGVGVGVGVCACVCVDAQKIVFCSWDPPIHAPVRPRLPPKLRVPATAAGCSLSAAGAVQRPPLTPSSNTAPALQLTRAPALPLLCRQCFWTASARQPLRC